MEPDSGIEMGVGVGFRGLQTACHSHKKQQHTQVTGTLDTETPLLLAHEGAIGEFISGDGLVLILFVKCLVA